MTIKIVAACSQTLPQAYDIHSQVTFSAWQYSTFADATTAPYCTRIALMNEKVAGYAQILMVVDEATRLEGQELHKERAPHHDQPLHHQAEHNLPLLVSVVALRRARPVANILDTKRISTVVCHKGIGLGAPT